MKHILMTFMVGVISTASVFGTAVMAQQSANTFNRLMEEKPPANLPPAKDGIHDAENPGTHELQPPKEAFSILPKTKHGNHVDWVQAVDDGKLTPRSSVDGTGAKPMVMNLDIVREVKGSMPDVVFPHDKHTEILACSNCHPDVFKPQKGANQMSMANIMLGQTCGVCHGAVAFPVTQSTCEVCHSKPKDESAELKRTQLGER
ncbi:MAG: cytochrome c3 family protein [Hydrogenovibrio sp.]|uniref:c(7)-type cytochrome triheme domain-containing protein n=1 Tax=Hydrogenovibrio sp. TaxID=2065821 RepID=UPI0028704A37|nr:c(7)-type cytochrome triheme domain-containing protein [Hydrogenovibrio sp.]MDR9499662.1 cytochrome c3 family protein [Hydrogenovibrio sp.]